jgi:hypothetical protein
MAIEITDKFSIVLPKAITRKNCIPIYNTNTL